MVFSGLSVNAQTSSGTVSIGLTVMGNPPSIGATILSPKDGKKFTEVYTTGISGTCQIETLVVVSDNGVPVGSTACTTEGLFSVDIQLFLGINELSALNYDNMNQAGPVTPRVVVTVVKKNNPKDTPTKPSVPDTPRNPTKVPDSDSTSNDCDSFESGDLPESSEPHVVIVCIPRLFSPNVMQKLGVIVWGGQPPYALSIDLGDDSSPILLSIKEPGYMTVSFSYAMPNKYKLETRLKDFGGSEASLFAAVQVRGDIQTPQVTLNEDIFDSPWFKTPVPLYFLALAVTVGFWLGDIFDRKLELQDKRARRKFASRG